jgi:hypothetical protein
VSNYVTKAIGETSDFYGGEYDNVCLTGCCALQSSRNWQAFQRFLLPSPSGRLIPDRPDDRDTNHVWNQATGHSISEDSHLHERNHPPANFNGRFTVTYENILIRPWKVNNTPNGKDRVQFRSSLARRQEEARKGCVKPRALWSGCASVTLQGYIPQAPPPAVQGWHLADNDAGQEKESCPVGNLTYETQLILRPAVILEKLTVVQLVK